MSQWRPAQNIRTKAIGLAWRDNRLLAAEVTDDTGRIKGVRPLGGSIEFGETWQAALTREFREELEVDITITGTPIVLENIFTHEGSTGHEIIFAAPIVLPQAPHLAGDKITFREDNGTICTAGWYALEQLDTDGLALYPTGLKQKLLNPSAPAPR